MGGEAEVKIETDWLDVSHKEIYWVECSKCYEEIESLEWEYCPFCGAKLIWTEQAICCFEKD